MDFSTMSDEELLKPDAKSDFGTMSDEELLKPDVGTDFSNLSDEELLKPDVGTTSVRQQGEDLGVFGTMKAEKEAQLGKKMSGIEAAAHYTPVVGKILDAEQMRQENNEKRLAQGEENDPTKMIQLAQSIGIDQTKIDELVNKADSGQRSIAGFRIGLDAEVLKQGFAELTKDRYAQRLAAREEAQKKIANAEELGLAQKIAKGTLGAAGTVAEFSNPITMALGTAGNIVGRVDKLAKEGATDESAALKAIAGGVAEQTIWSSPVVGNMFKAVGNKVVKLIPGAEKLIGQAASGIAGTAEAAMKKLGESEAGRLLLKTGEVLGKADEKLHFGSLPNMIMKTRLTQFADEVVGLDHVGEETAGQRFGDWLKKFVSIEDNAELLTGLIGIHAAFAGASAIKAHQMTKAFREGRVDLVGEYIGYDQAKKLNNEDLQNIYTLITSPDLTVEKANEFLNGIKDEKLSKLRTAATKLGETLEQRRTVTPEMEEALDAKIAQYAEGNETIAEKIKQDIVSRLQDNRAITDPDMLEEIVAQSTERFNPEARRMKAHDLRGNRDVAQQVSGIEEMGVTSWEQAETEGLTQKDKFGHYTGGARQALNISLHGTEKMKAGVKEGRISGDLAEDLLTTAQCELGARPKEEQAKLIDEILDAANGDENLARRIMEKLEEREGTTSVLQQGEDGLVGRLAEEAKAESIRERNPGITEEEARGASVEPVETEDGKISTVGDVVGSEPAVGKPVDPKPQTALDGVENAERMKGTKLHVTDNGIMNCNTFPELKIQVSGEGIAVEGLTAETMAKPESAADVAAVLAQLSGIAKRNGIQVKFATEDAAKIATAIGTEVQRQGLAKTQAKLDTRAKLFGLLFKTTLGTGVTYDEASFKEALGKTGNGRQFVDNHGNIYGFVDGEGKLHFNPTALNFNTPIHEYGHLALEAVKGINNKLWQRGMELIRQSDYYREIEEASKTDGHEYSYLRDRADAIADEALATMIGDKGEKLVTERGLDAALKSWLKEVWKAFKGALGVADLSEDQIEKMTLGEFVDTINAELLRGSEFGVRRRPSGLSRSEAAKARRVREENQHYADQEAKEAAEAERRWQNSGMGVIEYIRSRAEEGDPEFDLDWEYMREIARDREAGRFSIGSTLKTAIESTAEYRDSHGNRRILQAVLGNDKFGRTKYAGKHCVDYGTATTGGFTLDEIERYETDILEHGVKRFDKKNGRRTIVWKSPEGVTFTVGTFVVGTGRNAKEIVNTIHTDRTAKQTRRLKDEMTPPDGHIRSEDPTSQTVSAVPTVTTEALKSSRQSTLGIIPNDGNANNLAFAGEVEARNVQKRLDLSAEERNERMPTSTQDTPDRDQIVRFSAGRDGEMKETVFNGSRASSEGSSDGVSDSGHDTSPLRLPRTSGETHKIVPNNGNKVKERIRRFNAGSGASIDPSVFVFDPNAKIVAMGDKEQNAGGIAAGIEKKEALRPWTKKMSPADMAKPIAFDAADMVMFWRAVSGSVRNPHVQKGEHIAGRKNAIGLNVGGSRIEIVSKLFGVIDGSDIEKLRNDCKTDGFFRNENADWCAERSKEAVRRETERSKTELDRRTRELYIRRVQTGEGGMHYATQVLGHEIGHTLANLPSDARLGPVGSAMKTLYDSLVRELRRKTDPLRPKSDTTVNDEIKQLIAWWHGQEEMPKYYEKPKERFAELFGIFLTQPESVQSLAPKAYDTCVKLIADNAKLTDAYKRITALKWSGRSNDAVMKRVSATWDEEAQRQYRELVKESHKSIERFGDRFNYALNDRFGPMFGMAKRGLKAEKIKLKEAVKNGSMSRQEADDRIKARTDEINALKTSLYDWQRQSGGATRLMIAGFDEVKYRAEKDGVSWENVRKYAHLMRVIELGGRATAHGVDPARAAAILGDMANELGADAWTKIEKTWKAYRAVYEKFVLEDPNVRELFDDATNKMLWENKHYVTMKHRMGVEESAEWRAKIDEYRKGNGDAWDPCIDIQQRLYSGMGNAGEGGQGFVLHRLTGSFEATEDPIAATMKRAIEIKESAARNHLVKQMSETLRTCGVKGVFDTTGKGHSVDADVYGKLTYMDNGVKHELIVPRIIYKSFKGDTASWGKFGETMRFLRNTLTLWNPAFINRAYLIDKGSLETNLKGIHKPLVDIISEGLCFRGVGVPLYLVNNYMTRFTPIANTWIGKILWSENTVNHYAYRAQKIARMVYEGKFGERLEEANDLRKAGRTAEAAEIEENVAIAQEMLKRNIFQSQYEFNAEQKIGLSTDDILRTYGYRIEGEEAKTLKAKTWEKAKSAGRWWNRFEEEQEACTKIIAYLYKMKRDAAEGKTSEADDAARARLVIEQGGTPNLAARGVWASYVENATGFFWNVRKEGSLRTIRAIKDHPTEWITKNLMQTAAPALLKVLMLTGGLDYLIKKLFDDDEEKIKRSWWAPAVLEHTRFLREAMKCVPGYYQRNYNVIPIAKFGDEVLSLRVKYSPEEFALQNAIHTAFQKLGADPTDPNADWSTLAEGMWNEFLPNIFGRNYALDAIGAIVGPLVGINPYDAYRQRNFYDKTTWESRWNAPGNMLKEMGKNLWNYSPLGTFTTTFKNGQERKLEDSEVPEWLDKVLQTPFVRMIPASMLTITSKDSYTKGLIEKDEQGKATARVAARDILAKCIEKETLGGFAEGLKDLPQEHKLMAINYVIAGWRQYHMDPRSKQIRGARAIKDPTLKKKALEWINDGLKYQD